MPNLFMRLFKNKSFGNSITTVVNGLEHGIDAHHLTSFKDSLYLYIAVSKIVKRVAGIPLELYKIKNKQGNVEEVLDHPLLDLLHNPNEMQSQREFWELSLYYYLLSGDCFWYLEREGNRITQKIALRPDYVRIVLSPDNKRILAYEYRAGTIQTFRPEDILHIKNIDPTNPLRGSGAVRPASSRIATEIEATKYQANFFKNQGRPDMAVFSDGIIDDEAGNTFRARWKRIFGVNNGGGVAIFGSNVKSIQELNKTPKEMDFIGSQNFLRDDILAALHVPKAMVTTDDVNLANAKESYRIFLQEACVPVLEAFLDIVNYKLIPSIDDSLFFTFPDPTPTDRDALLKETTELKKNGIITANEARTLYNYELIEGADTLTSAPTNSFAAEQQAKTILRSRPTLVKRFTAKEEVITLLTLSEPKREMTSIFATKSMKDAYAKAYNKNVDKKAETLEEAINTVHDAMLKRVLATDLTPGGFMDVQGERIAAKQALKPIMVQMYQKGGQEALDALFAKSADQFFADAVLVAAIEGRVAFFTDSMVETTFNILKGKIVTGLSNGDGPDTIANDIRSYFTDMATGRAKTIARTETGFVLSKATNDAYNQSSVVTGKEWITVGDDRVRDEHVENDGKIVAKGGTFPSGEAYPAEHSINCRCVVAPAI